MVLCGHRARRRLRRRACLEDATFCWRGSGCPCFCVLPLFFVFICLRARSKAFWGWRGCWSWLCGLMTKTRKAS